MDKQTAGRYNGVSRRNLIAEVADMKRLTPIPSAFVDGLKRAGETGIGYQVVSVELRDGRSFDQVVASECCIIEVRGHKEIPFASEDVAAVNVNHKRWNFRDQSDVRIKTRAKAASA